MFRNPAAGTVSNQRTLTPAGAATLVLPQCAAGATGAGYRRVQQLIADHEWIAAASRCCGHDLVNRFASRRVAESQGQLVDDRPAKGLPAPRRRRRPLLAGIGGIGTRLGADTQPVRPCRGRNLYDKCGQGCSLCRRSRLCDALADQSRCQPGVARVSCENNGQLCPIAVGDNGDAGLRTAGEKQGGRDKVAKRSAAICSA